MRVFVGVSSSKPDFEQIETNIYSLDRFRVGLINLYRFYLFLWRLRGANPIGLKTRFLHRFPCWREPNACKLVYMHNYVCSICDFILEFFFRPSISELEIVFTSLFCVCLLINNRFQFVKNENMIEFDVKNDFMKRYQAINRVLQ